MTKLQVIKVASSGRAPLYAKAGVTIYEMPEDQGFAFYNEDMLRNNMVIREEVIFEKRGVETWISVLHYNEKDAGEWFLYCGDLLSPIQVFRIMRDIFEVYNSLSSLDEFLRFVDEMSVSNITAGQQSTAEKQRGVLFEISEEVEAIKGLIKG